MEEAVGQNSRCASVRDFMGCRKRLTDDGIERLYFPLLSVVSMIKKLGCHTNACVSPNRTRPTTSLLASTSNFEVHSNSWSACKSHRSVVYGDRNPLVWRNVEALERDSLPCVLS